MVLQLGGLGEVPTTPPCKTYFVTKYSQAKPRAWTDISVRHKQRKRDLRFDNIKKNEMGGACGAYGGRERCVQGFGGET